MIQAIYANLFSREPDSDGLAFWQQQIDSGAVPQAQAALAIMNIAAGTDAVAVGNKLTIANAFTAQLDTPEEIAGYSGANSASIARAFLAKVDATDTSMTSANATLSSNVAAATGTGTSTPLPPVVPTPAFVATLDPVTHEVSFSGSATGEISLTWSEVTPGSATATFSRDGNTSSPISFNSPTANTIKLALGETLVAAVDDIQLLNSLNLIAIHSVTGNGTVKLTDNSTSIDANALNTINSKIEPTVDATAFTTLTGSYTDTKAALNANGDSLTLRADVNLNLSITDFVNPLDSIDATGSEDILNLTSNFLLATNDLRQFTGLEKINLNLNSQLPANTFIADGVGTEVDASHSIAPIQNIYLGNGGQKFIGGSANDFVTGGIGGDTFTLGAGSNIVQFDYGHFVADSVTSLITSADTITDWASGSSNHIKFAQGSLAFVDHAAPAISGTASIVAGRAYFNADDSSLELKLNALVNSMGTDAVGTVATFVEGSDTYVFVVGDSTAGIQAGDALIKLSGLVGQDPVIQGGLGFDPT